MQQAGYVQTNPYAFPTRRPAVVDEEYQSRFDWINGPNQETIDLGIGGLADPDLAFMDDFWANISSGIVTERTPSSHELSSVRRAMNKHVQETNPGFFRYFTSAKGVIRNAGDALRAESFRIESERSELSDLAPIRMNLAIEAAFTSALSGFVDTVGDSVGVADLPKTKAAIDQQYVKYDKLGIDSYAATQLMFNPISRILEGYDGVSYQSSEFGRSLTGWERAARTAEGALATAEISLGGVSGLRSAAARLRSVAPSPGVVDNITGKLGAM